MKKHIHYINRLALVDFEMAKLLLDAFNEKYGTNFTWLRRRVTIIDEHGRFDAYTNIGGKRI